EAWKTPVTVENIPGAGGSVGAERVAKSSPDQRALLGGQRRNDYQPVASTEARLRSSARSRADCARSGGGGPALTDLLGGQVQVMFVTTVSSIGYIKAGRLRALAVTTATRLETLPDLPTVAEFAPGYEASPWFGVGAPKSTPVEIVENLNKEINAGLADPRIKVRLAELGGEPLPMSPGAFGKFIVDVNGQGAK